MRKNSYITVTDQFCGAGGSSQGARKAIEQHGGEIKLALNHWKLAIETHNANFPDTIHDCTDLQACDPRRYPSTDILITSPECFPAGTLILTKRGLIPIEEITLNDSVCTHLGRYRNVKRIMISTKDTIIVSGQGHRALETTAEHPFYTRNQTQKWDNSKRDYERKILSEPGWTAAKDLKNNTVRWATPNTFPNINVPEVKGENNRSATFTPEFWWMVGRWLGDGSIRIREGQSNEITICCGKHEADYLEKKLQFALKNTTHAAKDAIHWRRREIRTSVLFECSHDSLGQWIVDHFGKLAHGKTVPAWALSMQKEWREALLEGYISADGSRSFRVTTATSVSKKLALGIKLLATSLGYHVSLGNYLHGSSVIEGRELGQYLHWLIRWETNKSQRTGISDDLHSWTLVKSVSEGRKGVRVWNLSVEEDESYVADGIVVHNCTNHSLAKGQKAVKAQLDMFASGKLDPAAERSRATMWDVPRFAEYHKYNIIIVENVVDAIKWTQYPAWIYAMDLLGYNHKSIFHNSMHHHPTPQSRDRMYVIFWKKGNPAPDLDFRPKAFCPDCGKDVEAFQSWKTAKRYGKYKQQYVYACPVHMKQVEPYYYAAFNCIDWSDIGTRIGDRKKPLSENTIKRIEYGLKKYGKQPLQVMNYSPGYTRSMNEPTGSITTSDHHGIVTPFIFKTEYTPAPSSVLSVDKPVQTLTTRESLSMVMPFMFKAEHSANLKGTKLVGEAMQTQCTRQSMAMVVPYIVEMNRTGEAKPASEATATITAGGINHAIMAAPFIVENKGQSKARSINDPLATQTSKDYLGLISPDSWKSFISYYYGNHQASGINEAIGSCTTKDRHQLLSYGEPVLEDCFYRMLKPHEIKAAMAFESDYIILGSGKDQVKQCGNAVTPPVMEWIVERCVQSLNKAS